MPTGTPLSGQRRRRRAGSAMKKSVTSVDEPAACHPRGEGAVERHRQGEEQGLGGHGVALDLRAPRLGEDQRLAHRFHHVVGAEQEKHVQGQEEELGRLPGLHIGERAQEALRPPPGGGAAGPPGAVAEIIGSAAPVRPRSPNIAGHCDASAGRVGPADEDDLSRGALRILRRGRDRDQGLERRRVRSLRPSRTAPAGARITTSSATV